MKKLMLLTLIANIILVFPLNLKSQSPTAFSLKQAQEYAYQNNYDLKNSLLDIQIAKKEVQKNTAIGLPQINGNLNYTDNFLIPTILIPNFLSFLDTTGKAPKYLPLQFGTKYSVTAGATVTQFIYSGEYLVGLQTAKAYLETVRQKMIKDNMDVRDVVSEAYIGLLIINENTKILDSTYNIVNQMINEAREVYKNGLIEDIDVDQLILNRDNLEATLIGMKNQKLIAYNYLKFVIGLKADQEIILTDNLNYFLGNFNRDYLMNQTFDYNHNIDYSLLKKQEYMTFMEYKLAKTAYQPNLAAFLGINTQAMRPEWNFFDVKDRWYGSANWGLSLNVPIWSSGQRKHSVDEAKLNLDKIRITEEKTKVALNLQVETTKNDFNNSYLVFLNKQKGLAISKKIYEKTISKYKQGISTSTDLNQKYNQFLTAQSDYFQSLFSLLKVNITLTHLLEKI